MSNSNDTPGASPLHVDIYVFQQTPHPATTIEDALSAITQALAAELTPDSPPTVLSPRVGYQRSILSADVALTAAHLRALRQTPACTAAEQQHGAEAVLLFPTAADSPPSSSGAPPRRPVRLAVFDMDSTLIDQEVIDELAAATGQQAAVARITEQAMRGELDFAASLRARVALLAGAPVDMWKQLPARLSLAPGARELFAALRQLGATTAVFSGGFQPMAEWLQGQLGLDRAVANHLLESPPTDVHPFPHLTGQLDPAYPIVDAAAKRERLVALAAELGVPLAEVLCVGDGANDLPMLTAVAEGKGMAVACRAKPLVQAVAPNRLSGGRSLADLVYMLDPSLVEQL